jgi:hypothetical protein
LAVAIIEPPLFHARHATLASRPFLFENLILSNNPTTTCIDCIETTSTHDRTTTLYTMPHNAHSPRPNFPLPRELRDHIYSYLLDSVYTRVTRLRDAKSVDDRAGQGYQFHTSILGVNHAIHDEGQCINTLLFGFRRILLILRKAEDYLHKNNVFVVASFEWPDFDAVENGRPTYSQQLISPIVTDKHAARMKQHTLRLHITKNMDPLTARAPTGRPNKIPLHSILLVANDFRAFCFSWRHRLGALGGFAIEVEDRNLPTGRLRLLGVNTSGQKYKSPSLKIEFRDTSFRVADGALQRDLLGPLKGILCPSLQVSLKGVLRLPAELHIQNLKDTMGPNVISDQALTWHFFDTMLEGKHAADAAKMSGEDLVALRLYGSIADQLRHWRKTIAHPHMMSEMIALSGLMVDNLIGEAYLQLKMGHMRHLVSTCAELEPMLQLLLWARGPNSDGALELAQARLQHILLLEELFNLRSERIANGHLKTVGEAIELLSERPDERYRNYDLKILAAVKDKEDSASTHLLWKQCSVSKLEPIMSAVYQSNDIPQKPDYIIGLQNTKTLRELSAGMKEEINKAQRKFCAKVTQWD